MSKAAAKRKVIPDNVFGLSKDTPPPEVNGGDGETVRLTVEFKAATMAKVRELAFNRAQAENRSVGVGAIIREIVEGATC
jgi:hypothetical protein